jgi:mono/diheme cytochrome c family protein
MPAARPRRQPRAQGRAQGRYIAPVLTRGHRRAATGQALSLSRAVRGAPLALLAVGAAVGVGACGTQNIDVPTQSAYHKGAELFREHCSGCHTLAVVGAEGSASSIKDRLPNQGPNFNYRHETVENVLYAIRNGGFSGAIMPQNIVVGSEAQEIAAFLAHYAGTEAPKVPSIEIPQEEPSHPEGGAASSTEAAPAGSGPSAGMSSAHS